MYIRKTSFKKFIKIETGNYYCAEICKKKLNFAPDTILSMKRAYLTKFRYSLWTA